MTFASLATHCILPLLLSAYLVLLVCLSFNQCYPAWPSICLINHALLINATDTQLITSPSPANPLLVNVRLSGPILILLYLIFIIIFWKLLFVCFPSLPLLLHPFFLSIFSLFNYAVRCSSRAKVHKYPTEIPKSSAPLCTIMHD